LATGSAENSSVSDGANEPLDAVDIARMTAVVRAGTGNSSARLAAIVIVTVMFVALLVLGLVLAGHLPRS
jgi:hydrogenase/urease accessory protein HupE